MGRRAEVQRKLLEQIMGAEAMGIVTVTPSLWDPKVCRAFVTGVCTHDLFTNTKMDLGTCPRVHSPKLKNEYEAMRAQAEADKDETKLKELNRLRVDFEQEILGFVEECDRRIRMAQRRLEKTPEENARTLNLMREIGEVEGAYQAAMAEVELLGSEGKVEESLAQLTKAEALKSEKEEKERELQQLSETAGASGHQKLRVCDICGAYLSLLDSDRRLADHFGGRMHLGYHQLRVMMDEWRTRGPLPTGPAPPLGGPTNGASHAPPPAASYSGPPPPSGPSSYRPPPSAPTASAPRQPPSGPVVPSGPPAPGFVPASAHPAPGSSSSREAGRDRSDRDRDASRSDRDRSDRDRSDRDRDREPRSDRDREHRSDREREHRSDRDRDGHRSSRDDRDRDYHRSSRDDRDRDGHRSSSRRTEDEDRERRSSRRHDDLDDPKRSTSRRLEDAEERSDGDKRRKIEA